MPKSKPEISEEEEAAETPEPAAEAEPPAEEAGEGAEAAGESREAALEAEVAQLKDQLLRALAETENLRRRSQREREEAVRYAPAPLVRDLLGVADNLRRALESVPPEAASNDETLRTLLDGVEMTERELKSIFERHDIVKIDPIGQRLDPHLHEAMFEVPDPDAPEGTIVQVVQTGYMLHDRLLRPARVGVAKGGPPAKEPPAKGGPPATEPAAGSGAGEEPETDTGNGSAAPGSRIDTSA